MTRTSFAVAALAGALLVASCRGRIASGGVSDSTYVATMRELRGVALDTMLDSASRVAARERILTRHHVTAASMQTAARALARNPDHAIDVWRQISEQHAPPVVKKGPSK
jgi:hypothetical protein